MFPNSGSIGIASALGGNPKQETRTYRFLNGPFCLSGSLFMGLMLYMVYSEVVQNNLGVVAQEPWYVIVLGLCVLLGFTVLTSWIFIIGLRLIIGR